MREYTTLLFDLDDTLYDFHKTEKQALNDAFNKAGIENTKENTDLYQEINDKLWRDLEANLIKPKDIYLNRFPDLLKRLNITLNFDIEHYYETRLGEIFYYLEDDIPSLLDTLKKRYQMYVITNGLAYVQRIKMNDTSISSKFLEYFISEEVGFQKPNKEFFEHVLSKINVKPENCLIIGDSLSSDIQGGLNSNIDTCLINRNNIDTLLPTYQIDSLKKLLNFL